MTNVSDFRRSVSALGHFKPCECREDAKDSRQHIDTEGDADVSVEFVVDLGATGQGHHQSGTQGQREQGLNRCRHPSVGVGKAGVPVVKQGLQPILGGQAFNQQSNLESDYQQAESDACLA